MIAPSASAWRRLSREGRAAFLCDLARDADEIAQRLAQRRVDRGRWPQLRVERAAMEVSVRRAAVGALLQADPRALPAFRRLRAALRPKLGELDVEEAALHAPVALWPVVTPEFLEILRRQVWRPDGLRDRDRPRQFSSRLYPTNFHDRILWWLGDAPSRTACSRGTFEALCRGNAAADGTVEIDGRWMQLAWLKVGGRRVAKLMETV